MELIDPVGTCHLSDDFDGFRRQVTTVSSDQQATVSYIELSGTRKCVRTQGVEVRLNEVMQVVWLRELSHLLSQA